MNVLMILAGLLVLPVAVDIVTKGSFRRLALRNISRRKGEAVLVVAGSMLGTAIITASFIVGDTFDASIRDIARRDLGPTDEVVGVAGFDEDGAVRGAVLGTPIDGTDGTLVAVSTGASVATTGADRRAEPQYGITEFDFDEARRFGDDPESTGLADAGPTPAGDEAVINERLADDLAIGTGDALDVFAFGGTRTLTIRHVVPEVGLAGGSVLVAPGTIESLVADAGSVDARPPQTQILVSNVGGVFDGADGSAAVVDELERRVAGMGAGGPAAVEVAPVKQDLLDEAEASGDSIGQLFTAIGGFSVIAGILLLVNLFVMLAEERKRELGMMRAVGLKRNHLMRSFAIEGTIYAVLASLVGAVVSIGVGWAIMQVTRSIIAGEDDDFVFRLAIEPTSLATGAIIGLIISAVTVWATSARISSLNVIRAIRELPEPKTSRTRLRGLLLGVAGILVGGFLFAVGLGGAAIPALIGPPIALFSAIPVGRRFVPRRIAVVGLSLASLVWGLAAFNVLPETFENSDISVFVFQGIVLVAAAVTIVSQVDHLWVGMADRLSSAGRGLSTRLGLAYPLDRKFRTGMLLGMYAIVIFTMMFLSVFGELFARQGPELTEEASAGFDISLDSIPANPVPEATLAADPGVASVAPLVRSVPEFTANFEPDPSPWPMTGYDASLLANGGPALLERSAEYATDRAALEAVIADPSLAIVSEFFLQDGGGPPDATVDVGDTITVTNPSTGEERTLTVAGLHDDWMFNGVLVGDALARDLMGAEAVTSRFYVGVADGEDAEQVADALTGRLVANGADTDTFAAVVDAELAETNGFMRLMQGYLGLGLLIGIAGLGVVMIRAVRERRRQVGMLRAMGFSAAVVRRAFLLEASFVAVQGIVIGIGLGLVTAWQVMTQSDAFGSQELTFTVPWLHVAVILAVPLLASLLATVSPAAQAARIRPAAALRIAD
jgi:putative ABC transport system permease protein